MLKSFLDNAFLWSDTSFGWRPALLATGELLKLADETNFDQLNEYNFSEFFSINWTASVLQSKSDSSELL